MSIGTDARLARSGGFLYMNYRSLLRLGYRDVRGGVNAPRLAEQPSASAAAAASHVTTNTPICAVASRATGCSIPARPRCRVGCRPAAGLLLPRGYRATGNRGRRCADRCSRPAARTCRACQADPIRWAREGPASAASRRQCASARSCGPYPPVAPPQWPRSRRPGCAARSPRRAATRDAGSSARRPSS